MMNLCMSDKERPIIKCFFEQNIDEIYKTDDIYNEIIQSKEEMIEQMQLSEIQKSKLDKYSNLECKIVDLVAERAFTYGFIIGSNLQKELKIE